MSPVVAWGTTAQRDQQEMLDLLFIFLEPFVTGTMNWRSLLISLFVCCLFKDVNAHQSTNPCSATSVGNKLQKYIINAHKILKRSLVVIGFDLLVNPPVISVEFKNDETFSKILHHVESIEGLTSSCHFILKIFATTDIIVNMQQTLHLGTDIIRGSIANGSKATVVDDDDSEYFVTAAHNFVCGVQIRHDGKDKQSLYAERNALLANVTPYINISVTNTQVCEESQKSYIF